MDENNGYFVNQYTFPSQFGTHIDSPVHFDVHQEKYVNDFTLKELVQPLVVIDHSAAANQDNDMVLTVEDIKK